MSAASAPLAGTATSDAASSGGESASGAPALGSRLAGQGALLIAGIGAAQGLSLARNALVGHMLSKGDFGVAATLTLMLQMIDALSDLGVDRLLVQAPDGDEPRLQAVAHAMLVARGLLTGLVLVALAPVMAGFFRIPDAEWALTAVAVVPVIKGLQHLDARRAQRRLDNRALMLIEVVPQAAVLVLAYPMLRVAPGYAAVLWLSLLQAVMTTLASHVLATRGYRLAFDTGLVKRFLAFGWPILASALPLAAIFQGDRIVIGRMLGMEPLAAYSTAFMVTMVPGLVAAKVANALMLPLFADRHRRDRPLLPDYRRMCDATVLAACCYLAGFIVAGGAVLPLAFGGQYAGLADVVSWLALMWALRMVQAVPGMALMAKAHTRPLLTAGIIRAAALVPAFVAAHQGAGLAGIAAMGCLGEVASLLYVAWRADRVEAGLGSALMARGALIMPAAVAALVVRATIESSMPHAAAPLAVSLLAATLLCLVLAGAGLALSPALRALVRPLLARAQPA